MAVASVLNLTRGYGGLCLKWVRLVFGVPAKAATALGAWNAADLKVYDRTPPKGVPVFLTAGTNGAGHVCYSRGGGKVRSTDDRRSNRIFNTTIAWLEQAWHRKLLGYTLDLNGHLVSPKVTKTLRRGAEGDQVVFLQGRLKWAGFKPGRLDGSFGPSVDDAVRAFQKKHKLTVDGIVGPKTRAALNRVG